MKYTIFFFVCLLGIAQLSAQDQDSLKTKNQQVLSDRAELRDNLTILTGQDLIDDSFPRSFPIFGTGVRMSFYGYLKLDYLQDFNGIRNDRFQTQIQNVPVEGDGLPVESGYNNLSTRESRFGFDVRTKSPKGKPIRVLLEMDFYNTSDGPFNQKPRLRHFYVTYGKWLAGRTWDILTELKSVPVTLDFGAGDALAGGRRAQIRYQDKISENYSFAAGLEMNEFMDLDGNGFVGKGSSSLPMLSARISRNLARGGIITFGGRIYQVRWDGQDQIPNDTKAAYGVVLAGRYYVTKNGYVLLNGSYGDGWGSSIVSQIGTNSTGVLNPNGKIETLASTNLIGGFGISLTEKLITNGLIGYSNLEKSQWKDDNAFKGGLTSNWNFTYFIEPNLMLGTEVIYAQRENQNGNTGDAWRWLTSIKYSF